MLYVDMIDMLYVDMIDMLYVDMTEILYVDIIDMLYVDMIDMVTMIVLGHLSLYGVFFFQNRTFPCNPDYPGTQTVGPKIQHIVV